ncbi:g5312 [Coccomyxa viridis]|uniref:G5312 protein n=1 Tax=Coccomyxa viridis TaxID=1274662 RepID=A0ABP1FUT1_9CHLO
MNRTVTASLGSMPSLAGSKSSLKGTGRPAGALRLRLVRARAEDEGKTSTTERPVESSSNGSNLPKETEALLAEMPAEQQKQLSQLYFFLTQNPGSRPQFNNINWAMAQRAIADDYQRLIWGPAEILNGRMAMIGFTLGFITQLRTGVSVWGQLNAFPFAYLWAYGLVVIGSLLNQAFGSPKEGVTVGPVKFSRTAELINGRAAMVGYAVLAYLGYNQDLQRGVLLLLQQNTFARMFSRAPPKPQVHSVFRLRTDTAEASQPK